METNFTNEELQMKKEIIIVSALGVIIVVLAGILMLPNK